MSRIGVVICNYNKKNDVLVAIRSVLESTVSDLHIYVADNASTDGSVEAIRQEFGDHEKITLVVNPENLGGSGGFNAGLREALKTTTDYLFCLDNDAFLDEDCLKVLADFLDTHPDTGIAAAKIYNTQEPDYVQQYGSYIDFNEFLVDSPYFYALEDGSHPEVVYSDAVPACALMIRKSLVDQIGLMPEEFFLYWDDTEWCERCREAGFKVASVGAAAACHAMGAKKEVYNTFPTYYAWRNRVVFFILHTPEDRLERLAESVLGDAFDVFYDGKKKNAPNRFKTVLAAIDDALNGRMGKAGPDRIFEIENPGDTRETDFSGEEYLLSREVFIQSEKQKFLDGARVIRK